MSWVVTGDFDEVLYESDKQVGNACDFTSIMGFRGVLDTCELRDLGFSGY